MTKQNNHQYMKWLKCVALVALGTMLGLLLFKLFIHVGREVAHHVPHIELRKNHCSEKYAFINVDLACDKEADLNNELVPFQEKLNELKSAAVRSRGVDELSVYFRDLSNGPWFGIDIEKQFTPASLFKLPIAISIYWAAESVPGILQEKITYATQLQIGAEQNVVPEQTAELGKTYTVEELVDKMLVYSDNVSTVLLSNALQGRVNFNKVFSDLGISVDEGNPESVQVSTKSFSALYRVLYNASYLNKLSSDKLLSALSRSTEAKTLFAGIPDSVPVAAKFGERAFTNSPQKFLHNCGIVYYPNHPYLLCIMTVGSDSAKLEKAIEDFSRTIYQEVDRQYKDFGVKQNRQDDV